MSSSALRVGRVGLILWNFQIVMGYRVQTQKSSHVDSHSDGTDDDLQADTLDLVETGHRNGNYASNASSDLVVAHAELARQTAVHKMRDQAALTSSIVTFDRSEPGHPPLPSALFALTSHAEGVAISSATEALGIISSEAGAHKTLETPECGSKDGVQLGCTSGCHCGWSQHCYPRIIKGADRGVCQASVVVMMALSIFVFMIVLVSVMVTRTCLHMRECDDELDFENSKEHGTHDDDVHDIWMGDDATPGSEPPQPEEETPYHLGRRETLRRQQPDSADVAGGSPDQ